MIGGTSSFGSPSGSYSAFSPSVRAASDPDDPAWADEKWTGTGVVPDLIPEVPGGRLTVLYPSSGLSIKPNDTVTSGLVS